MKTRLVRVHYLQVLVLHFLQFLLNLLFIKHDILFYINILHDYFNFSDETTRNPIGRLQELCILRRWTPPIYDTEKEIGQAHNKNFVMVCKVAQFQEEGEGSSKKIAKRKAAFKMLKFLTTMNEESLENGIETSIINRYNDIKDLNFKKMGPNSKKDFEQAFAKMRTDTTPGIVELQVMILLQFVISFNYI